MDPASLTIGIIGLSTVLLKTARKLRETVQDIRYARGDLSDVFVEIDLFAGTCDDFLDVCDEDPSISERTQKLKLQLNSWTTRTVQGFDSLLDKVQAVARNPEDDYSAIEVLTAHIVWLRSKGTLKYLRASLGVARQNMICFTNIRIIEKLNMDLAQLKSVLSSTKTEKRRVEMLYNMTVEKRIEITQHKIRKRHAQRSKIKAVLKEAIKEVAVHEKKIKDPDFVPQTKSLRQFGNSVSQYVTNVVVQEKVDRRVRRSDQGSSSITSRSTATTPTQSTHSSYHQASAPESPPTSPEPTEEDPRIKEYEEAVEILREFDRKRCNDTGAHTISNSHTPTEAASQTSLVVPPVVPPPPSKPERKIRRGRASSCPQPNRIRLSSQSPVPHRHRPAEPDVYVLEDAHARIYINPIIQEEDEDDLQNETEERSSSEEPARNVGPSIWQATGAFEGDIPRGLRIRRQRSRSPQDFW